MPECFSYLWQWFLRLSNKRGGGFGPAPLTWEAIDAWSRRTGIEPNPWELEQLDILDSLWLKVQSEESKKAAPKKKKEEL